MSVFNPEMKEFSESKFEANKFSTETERKLLKALDAGMDRFPDIVQCPNQRCANPLVVEFVDAAVRITCKWCGWNQVLRRPTHS